MILDQAVTYLSHYFGSGCWLLLSVFWRRLLVAVPIISDQSVDYFSIILDQAVGYCSHFLKSGCWSFVAITLDQAVGYSSYYFGSTCWLLFLLFWIRLLVTVPIIVY
jgi:hypothetical protein